MVLLFVYLFRCVGTHCSAWLCWKATRHVILRFREDRKRGGELGRAVSDERKNILEEDEGDHLGGPVDAIG